MKNQQPPKIAGHGNDLSHLLSGLDFVVTDGATIFEDVSFVGPRVFCDVFFFFFKLGFTPCKDEQPLGGMELQEKKKAQKRLQDTENLFRKNLQLKDVS